VPALGEVVELPLHLRREGPGAPAALELAGELLGAAPVGSRVRAILCLRHIFATSFGSTG